MRGEDAIRYLMAIFKRKRISVKIGVENMRINNNLLGGGHQNITLDYRGDVYGVQKRIT